MQLSDFGLAHTFRDGSVCFEPVNTNIRGTPGQERVTEQETVLTPFDRNLFSKS